MRIVLITGAGLAGIAIFLMIEFQKNGRLSVVDAIGAVFVGLFIIGAVFAFRH